MRHFWGLLLLLFGVNMVQAGGFQIPMQGQKQMGMGNVGTALPQDASVMFYNPGALSFTKRSQVSANIWFTLLNVQFLEEGTNQLYKANKKVLTPFSVYGSFNLKPADKWKAGIAVYTPYGAIIEWPSNWAGQYILSKANINTINIQPTFSYNIANKVGIGAGLVYSVGSVDLSRALPLQDTAGNTASVELSGRASAVGFNVGVYYDISKKFSIGASYQHKLTYSPKKGSATFNVPTALKDSFPDNTISTTLVVPYSINVGATYRPTVKVALSFDVSYVGWSVFDNIHVKFAKTNKVVTDFDLPRHFNNAFSFKLGGQYAINNTFTIRGGTYIDLTPVPDGYVPPEVPDANRYGASLGVTGSFGHFELDVAFSYAQSLVRQELRSQNYAGLGGTYQGSGIVIGIGAHYNFYKEKKKDK